MYAHDASLYASSPPTYNGKLSTIIRPHNVPETTGDLVSPFPNEVKIRKKKYQTIDVLGKGGFATVYLVKENGDSTGSLAVKCVRQKEGRAGHGIPSLMEASIMASYEHPNIVSARFIDSSPSTLYIFQEVAVCDLTTWRLNIKPTAEMVRVLFHSLLRALEFLHSENIIHADVKDGNVLVYDLLDFRLGDGSLSYDAAWPKRHLPCTNTFRPLEGWTADWNEKVDIFALGCTIYRIVFDEYLLQRQIKEPKEERYKRCTNALLDWEEYFRSKVVNETDITLSGKRYPEIEYNKPSIDERLSTTNDDLLHLMVSALHPDPRARPSAVALLRSPIFTGLPVPRVTNSRPIIRIAQMDDDHDLPDVVNLPIDIRDASDVENATHAVLELASRIKSRYLSVINYKAARINNIDLVNRTVIWMAKKLLKVEGKSLPDRSMLSAEHKICRAVKFVLH